jgi:hypothetical protein
MSDPAATGEAAGYTMETKNNNATVCFMIISFCTVWCAAASGPGLQHAPGRSCPG